MDRMAMVQSAGHTATNTKGAYTVKVWLSQAARGMAARDVVESLDRERIEAQRKVPFTIRAH